MTKNHKPKIVVYQLLDTRIIILDDRICFHVSSIFIKNTLFKVKVLIDFVDSDVWTKTYLIILIFLSEVQKWKHDIQLKKMNSQSIRLVGFIKIFFHT